MTPRIDYTKLAPKALQAIMGVENYVRQSSLEQSLKSLVKLRVSYMNGCAYCVDMHSKDARAEGETEQRVYAVPVWADTPFFSERERAAFEWAEAVTRLGEHAVPDSLYESTLRHFSEAELVDLNMAVVAINIWNRIAIPFRAEVGSYQPPRSLSGHSASSAA